ncbi:MAG: Gfo/Idh/MocA family protein [Pyrinomonadaceae bacterium]
MKDKVGIGIIGTGFARKVQIPAFLVCEYAVVSSIASGTVKNAQAAADEFGIAHYTGDWRETVARKDVDLVCITTPPKLHREMALFAISHGKNVLCEKPMAMNVAEAKEMTDAALSKNLLALIDHELRFQPGRQKAFAMLRDRAIGKVRHAKYNFRAPHRGDPNLSWNWWSDIEKGGGALGAINSHIIDSFRWLLGTEIGNVSCQLQTHVKERRDASGETRKVTTDDEANMLLRFADSELTEDATGLVSVSMTEGPSYVNCLEVFGTDGEMRIGHTGELWLAKRGENDWTTVDTDMADAISGVPDTGFSRGFMMFAPKIVEAILDGRNTIEYAATFEDGLAVQKVLDAARESNAVGRVITV